MAPVARSKSSRSKVVDGRKKAEDGPSVLSLSWWKTHIETYGNAAFVKKLLFDPQYTWTICIFLLVCEVFINGLVIVSRPCNLSMFKKS